MGTRVVRLLILLNGLLLGLLVGVALGLVLALLALRPPALAAAAPPQPWDVTIGLTPDFLAARLNEPPSQGQAQRSVPVQLKDPKISFQDEGTITIIGQVAPSGGPGQPPPGRGPPPGAPRLGNPQVEIVLRPTVSDGQLKMTLVRAQLGNLVAPDQVTNILDGVLNSRIASSMGGKPYQVVEAQVSGGLLIIRGKRA